MYVLGKIGTQSRIIVAVGKQSVLYLSACVRVRAYVRVCAREGWSVVLLIKLATRMRHIVTSFVASGSTKFLGIIS
jgi:putative effector of murein hydrolase LrgA (UPF0299 family)